MPANTGNAVVDFLIKTRQALTVRNYISLDSMGDFSRLDELDAEQRAEVEELVEAGLLAECESDQIH